MSMKILIIKECNFNDIDSQYRDTIRQVGVTMPVGKELGMKVIAKGWALEIREGFLYKSRSGGETKTLTPPEIETLQRRYGKLLWFAEWSKQNELVLEDVPNPSSTIQPTVENQSESDTSTADSVPLNKVNRPKAIQSRLKREYITQKTISIGILIVSSLALTVTIILNRKALFEFIKSLF